ncbi:hypothetical protein AMTR_s00163p00047920 [Amborella trichopoda]|uniref:Uncharacterized protein n=1 Tax=Amborella trichopoda TaxID=13333 RepID=W1PPD9_AMBTC|nr:hypothetical protein AMTR_s00163p00047920 [Amborella trichopoda]
MASKRRRRWKSESQRKEQVPAAHGFASMEYDAIEGGGGARVACCAVGPPQTDVPEGALSHLPFPQATLLPRTAVPSLGKDSLTIQKHLSTVAYYLLVAAANMHHLFHRKATMKAHLSPSPLFDPLQVDLLVVVVLDEMDEPVAEEHLHPDHVVVGGAVEDPGLVLVKVASPPPLAAISNDDNPLLLHQTSAPLGTADLTTITSVDPVAGMDSLKHGMDGLESGLEDAKENLVASLVSYCGMNYDLPIAVVYKDIIAKKKLGNWVSGTLTLCPWLLRIRPRRVVTQRRMVKVRPFRTRSSARLQARGVLRATSPAPRIVITEDQVFYDSFSQSSDEEDITVEWKMLFLVC